MSITAGNYEAVCTGHQWDKNKDGKPVVVLSFKLLEGEHFGKHVNWWGHTTEKSIDITLKALRNAGWKGNDLDNLGELNQRVSLAIEPEDYEDEQGNKKTTTRVKWVNRAGGGVTLKNPPSSDELRMFAAQMRAKASGVKEVDGETIILSQMPSEQPEEPPPITDEIPF